MLEKPEWLKRTYREDPNLKYVRQMLSTLHLNTICDEAMCPNFVDCFSKKTATFMILGVNCTRNCRFCNVTNSDPQRIDADEPKRIAEAVSKLGLKYVVITSVTRDDLPDGGAAHFAATIRSIHELNPDTAVEVLIPDLLGDKEALKLVTDANPEVISHNIETVKELYDQVRPQAIYERSLDVLKSIKELAPHIRSKTGIMLGLGEKTEQVYEVMDDLRAVGCEFLTIGQYLAPSAAHYPVQEYITPDQFDRYGKIAEEKGFAFVASAPFVRSSYNAAEALEAEA
ncbi:lipoyl synthase [Anaerotignum sp. MB30-C6]|uniref:lipoyl synthase n=1 Tax=Anaerotignum sp. MB30-C6 TaxID=3070814 RepID=UPI0027DC3162|nr:lipoyl synthase [Anaerotignum sp. MB30-C6]WMI82215.1 lipoyl synthase [Anaerotignum sp. MB30-C6]